MTSYDYMLKGRALNQKYNKESNAEALKMLNLAIEADKDNPLPYSWKACTMGQAMGMGFVEQTDEWISEMFAALDVAKEKNENDWNKIVKPDEIEKICKKSSLSLKKIDGVKFNPILNKWGLSSDKSVNYLSLIHI